MNFFKTTVLSGITTLLRLLSGFISAKVCAVYLGPAGFAIIGQFQNIVQIIQTFAGNMVSSGVVKYVAEYRDVPDKKQGIIGTALLMCLLSSGLIGTGLLLFRQQIAMQLLKSTAYSNIITLLAVTIILFVLNTLVFSILNGERDIKRYTLCNIITIISGLLLTTFLVVHLNVMGALIAIVINQSVVFVFNILVIKPKVWLKWLSYWNKANKDSFIKLCKFAIMALTAALLLPVVQIILRDYIVSHFSWQQAGYWQAITKVSDAYLMLITTTLSVYYLPRLSELNTKTELKSEIIFAYKAILPVVILAALIIWLFKIWIVKILYSPAFMSMLPMFKYQLLGDVLKIGSWLVAYLMVAKAMTRLFILSEIFFGASYCIIAIIMMHFYGLIGITMAFAINYAAYWLFMAVVFYGYLRKEA